MKSLVYALVAISVLAAPAVSFAQQSSSTVTREQVKAELTQLEKAGYNPGRRDPNYPEDIRAAQARVAAQNGTVPAQTGYGPAVGGSSGSGVPSK
ncbi:MULTISPECIES: DUF4148 domain-containing protein [Paraburkholderia]|uniref:DUF4148 domain-containing protein n=1 Tax=Paraburkholderia madseniana TaxID=2599607 RepID=A0AAP5F028_9BURK|nr:MULTISPECIES: DUF4148 domain-containing protein [Paraburkholderia]MCX4150164.1 DUF4148 domain-containing protein [Paraburkholderia madseniana]MDN7153100.1 DUF4148 domain-containing protein [Paraburkholderia sp. WS6]MDQ6411982.1 DUF4148 domain-containing protein [Paraburkholderia madseniana]SOE68594.1 protein of unknown function [Burkholderia sp. OK233]